MRRKSDGTYEAEDMADVIGILLLIGIGVPVFFMWLVTVFWFIATYAKALSIII